MTVRVIVQLEEKPDLAWVSPQQKRSTRYIQYEDYYLERY